MRLLILGGTVFLGRHLVEAAIAREHEMTLFNRGQHNPELFPGAEKLRGDRDGDLNALRGREWDAVIDTCGYVPRVVAQSADLLVETVERYIFISSISVYADASRPGVNEDSPLLVPETGTEEITGESYGPLKVACEQVVEQSFPGRSLIIRPGLIVGPHDPTDRFTYWPVRLHRGGDVLAPAPRNAPVQVIDVRDLAEWIIRCIEEGTTGVLNATGPEHPLTMAEMLHLCREAIDSKARLRWLPADYLLAAGVEPWSDLPLWLADDETAGLLATDVSRALATGLVFRPLSQTARDTLAWAHSRPAGHQWRAGLSAEREQALLAGQN
ncbi:MAG: SDR family oxidoreductase [Chloroflexota bacterium]